MTTLQRKFLKTAPALLAPNLATTNAAACFETTTPAQQRVTMAVLIDSLDPSSVDLKLVERVWQRVRRTCQRPELGVEQRLQDAVNQANALVRKDFPRSSGASLLIVAVTEQEVNKDVELCVQLAHSGNCCAYLIQGEVPKTKPDSDATLVLLNPIETWGSWNVERKLLPESDKNKAQHRWQWDAPLDYLGAGETITPNTKLELPPDRQPCAAPNSLRLQKNDQILLTSAKAPKDQLEGVVKSNRQDDPQTVVKKIAARNIADPIVVMRWQPYRKVAWSTVAYNSLAASFWFLRWLLLLALLVFLGFWLRETVLPPFQRAWATVQATINQGATAVAVKPTPTSTPVPPTPLPSPTSTNISTATPKPLPIAAPIETAATAAVTLGAPDIPPTATFTPIPTVTPLPSATGTETPLPTTTVTEISTTTVETIVARLELPADANYSVQQGNQQEFRWLWSGELADNQVFTILIKKQEEQEFSGLPGATSINTTARNGIYSFMASVNREPGNYQWTVALVESGEIVQRAVPKALGVTSANASEQSESQPTIPECTDDSPPGPCEPPGE